MQAKEFAKSLDKIASSFWNKHSILCFKISAKNLSKDWEQPKRKYDNVWVSNRIRNLFLLTFKKKGLIELSEARKIVFGNANMCKDIKVPTCYRDPHFSVLMTSLAIIDTLIYHLLTLIPLKLHPKQLWFEISIVFKRDWLNWVGSKDGVWQHMYVGQETLINN